MAVSREVFLPSGTIVGNVVQAPNGSPDALPSPTKVNFQPIDACLELQANNKALCLNRLTTAERDNLIATPGMLIYNVTTGFYEVYTSGNIWEALTQGSSGGITPFYVTAGPVQMIANAVYYVNSHSTITFTLPAVVNIGDIIEISSQGENFIIAQNANQKIQIFNAFTSFGVGGSVTTNSKASIYLEFATNVFNASSYSGTFTLV